MKQYDSSEQAKIAEEFRREQQRQQQLKQMEKLKAQQRLISGIPKDSVLPYEQSLLPTVQQKAAAARKQSASLQNGWRAPIGFKGGELNEETLASWALGKNQKGNPKEQFALDKNINRKAAYSAPEDVTKMTYDDYLNALDNNDQLTANAYNAALRSRKMPYPYISTDQRARLIDYNLKQLPSGFKNVLSFVPGLQDSLMPNYRKTFNKGAQSQDAYNYTVDQLIKSAPIGYGAGKIAGNALTTTGTAMMLGGAPASASYLGQMGSWGVANGLQSVISDAAQGKNFQDTAKDALINAAIGALTGGNLKYLSEMLPQAGTIGFQQLATEYGPTVARLVAQAAKVLNPGAAEAAKGFGKWDEQYLGRDMSKIYDQNLKQYDMMPYGYFKKKSIPFDNLDGHETWQHANIKAQGLADERLSGDVSKDNPVLVVDSKKHKFINKSQRKIIAKNQSPLDNIGANYEILVENGIPEDIADWMRIWSEYNQDRHEGK